ncbi:MAG: imidazole glycerol phosphate synthase, glutamine amidotransferase subunit [Gammaproteobacteria bacterium RIFCSPLOWO2_02_FULL_42_14]|nr:MAG: imidazole glycerol phosphate synthase, glutamine amidotransferase subunit [Gammaproteobacteria bacterium RIFCSPHIGHO2_02_FULL_42_43]OGT28559.1 MAG: imidazole glycerol phosphate synthase, glutamine amidotransferase subunit [Gammaproteobacteria bacterium RIFCSPHIGHO2_01_FULL_42_8]OGT51383.1 MAG: imidazole glycerol phosphate synthase, glutamine amidotransferase subunit [Gammaproteobacteria bacterium RIFCSPHIGHO2_12_FULL_41_25]OGT62085.1 MAG: imidazole glycerol phosphate synthase, glutamine 
MLIKNKNIVVVDYGLGNLKSLHNAFRAIGIEVIVSSNQKKIDNADGMIIPGVGAFGVAMQKIKTCGLFETINHFLYSQKPVLGICLGMQLLFEKSEEAVGVSGFSYFLGDVKKLSVENTKNMRLPHIGWKKLSQHEKSTPLFSNSILSHLFDQTQYFVHSFIVNPQNSTEILATSQYAKKEFACAVQKNNVIGVQFHPEKSRAPGLNVLKNFVDLC